MSKAREKAHEELLNIIDIADGCSVNDFNPGKTMEIADACMNFAKGKPGKGRMQEFNCFVTAFAELISAVSNVNHDLIEYVEDLDKKGVYTKLMSDPEIQLSMSASIQFIMQAKKEFTNVSCKLASIIKDGE